MLKRFVEHCHKATLHGGLQSRKCLVRERFWTPQLRRIVKVERHRCNGCNRLRAKGMHLKGFSMLPKARIELSEPFHTTGVDFAGPLLYKMGKKKVSKAYVILFTCASTRAVHLALCKTMTIDGFQRNLR